MPRGGSIGPTRAAERNRLNFLRFCRRIPPHERWAVPATMRGVPAVEWLVRQTAKQHGDAMPRLSESVSHAIRQFSFWIANRSVGHPLLDGIDYSCIFEEPSAMEQVYAIFANTLELDERGMVLNEKHAERRAAQFIRSYVEPEYVVEPPLEDWEVHLY
jgi:hypothetical protein